MCAPPDGAHGRMPSIAARRATHPGWKAIDGDRTTHPGATAPAGPTCQLRPGLRRRLGRGRRVLGRRRRGPGRAHRPRLRRRRGAMGAPAPAGGAATGVPDRRARPGLRLARERAPPGSTRLRRFDQHRLPGRRLRRPAAGSCERRRRRPGNGRGRHRGAETGPRTGRARTPPPDAARARYRPGGSGPGSPGRRAGHAARHRAGGRRRLDGHAAGRPDLPPDRPHAPGDPALVRDPRPHRGRLHRATPHDGGPGGSRRHRLGDDGHRHLGRAAPDRPGRPVDSAGATHRRRRPHA
ncbi:Hypothetical protein AAM4_2726 [Actinomyces succiniciruminis]|uniref:Uncharacterized protein n=1 Tax=Actinomyces succiniciruminis TaxID=1522002 RepID=A0A1L7RSG2_9ACTO|nr:Hypothetical protein AAM4_2726 [Actinomyces succiniciruminis]